MKLDGCVALVTGANRGLGAAYARALLDRHAAKVYAAVRQPDAVSDPRLVLGGAALACDVLVLGAAVLLAPHAAAASAAASGTARIHLRLTIWPSVCACSAGIGYPLRPCLSGAKRVPAPRAQLNPASLTEHGSACHVVHRRADNAAERIRMWRRW